MATLQMPASAEVKLLMSVAVNVHALSVCIFLHRNAQQCIWVPAKGRMTLSLDPGSRVLTRSCQEDDTC